MPTLEEIKSEVFRELNRERMRKYRDRTRKRVYKPRTKRDGELEK
jgi:hypothetical protein